MKDNLQEFQESQNLSEKAQEQEENRLEEKNKKTKKSSYFQKIKFTLEKIKKSTQNLVLPKMRAKFKSSCVFETVQDARSIFKIERKIGDYLILIALFFFLTSFIEFIIILTLLPLKEKEPYLVTFTNDTQSFAIIQKADQSITANEALNRQLVGAYILSRENINRIDDKEKNEVVREQSSPEVWRVFERIIAQEDSIYSNENLTREVKIINISIIKKGYANADVSISLFYNGILKSEKRYRIIISYKFKTLAINYKSLPKNPTGFTVTGYSITEIATIKDLDEENKVNSSKSRIKYTDKKSKPTNKNDDDILNDAYFYQEIKEKKVPQDDSGTKEDSQNPKDIKKQIKEIKTLLQEHQNDISPSELSDLKEQLQQLKQNLENTTNPSDKAKPSPFSDSK